MIETAPPGDGDVVEAKVAAATAVRAAADDAVALSHRIHDRPETALAEHHAAQWLADACDAAGMEVERAAYGLETAFVARAGDRGPHVVLCAEYDALPRIGHACGHNIIGAVAVAAGAALAPLARSLGVRVTVLGTPAEETVGGKNLLADAGAFEDADAALMLHPAPLDIAAVPALAVEDLVVTVRGRAAHAALAGAGGGRAPRALDTLVDVYRTVAAHPCGEWERCAGVITDGGDVPNVVPHEATARFFLRARTATDAADFAERVRDEVRALVAETGCSVEFDGWQAPYREFRQNAPLNAAYEANARAVGREFVPQALIGPESATSTDMGAVSQRVPSIHPMLGIDSGPALPHTPGFADAAVSDAADRALVDGAVALAWTALDVVLDPTVLAAARASFDGAGPLGDPI